ncbi:MAG: hypothetical protein JST22_05405 [Bacteroidetes bacterium]|nr:hypothetical protein [Bacteroidota bacterium]
MKRRFHGGPALLAASHAIMQALGNESTASSNCRGLVLGSSSGPAHQIVEFMTEVRRAGARLANPGLFPLTVPNAAAGLLAIELGCRGPNLTFNDGASSSLDAMAAAADLLNTDCAEIVLAAALESGIPAASGWEDSAVVAARNLAPTIAAVIALVPTNASRNHLSDVRVRLISHATMRLEQGAVDAAIAETVAAAFDAAEVNRDAAARPFDFRADDSCLEQLPAMLVAAFDVLSNGLNNRFATVSVGSSRDAVAATLLFEACHA